MFTQPGRLCIPYCARSCFPALAPEPPLMEMEKQPNKAREADDLLLMPQSSRSGTCSRIELNLDPNREAVKLE